MSNMAESTPGLSYIVLPWNEKINNFLPFLNKNVVVKEVSLQVVHQHTRMSVTLVSDILILRVLNKNIFIIQFRNNFYILNLVTKLLTIYWITLNFLIQLSPYLNINEYS